ncbi:hypothetical protein GCM10007086_24930 [Photobacterium aphoticum]|nr:hypothetical protein GCM10007086_24930 [Photobacterium aphoticum]
MIKRRPFSSFNDVEKTVLEFDIYPPAILTITINVIISNMNKKLSQDKYDEFNRKETEKILK